MRDERDFDRDEVRKPGRVKLSDAPGRRPSEVSAVDFATLFHIRRFIQKVAGSLGALQGVPPRTDGSIQQFREDKG